MKRWRFNRAYVTALFFVAGSLSIANAAPIDELISGAKKEGAIELYAPSTLTPQGAQSLGQAFNKRLFVNSSG